MRNCNFFFTESNLELGRDIGYISIYTDSLLIRISGIGLGAINNEAVTTRPSRT